MSVLPREVVFDTVTDEPIHVDFLRIVKGGKVKLEIPVKFINSENSPGLKRGGVLNIVRRKVELNCPTENIPSELIVDLDGVDIGQSFKISSIFQIMLPQQLEEGILLLLHLQHRLQLRRSLQKLLRELKHQKEKLLLLKGLKEMQKQHRLVKIKVKKRPKGDDKKSAADKK